MWGKQVFREIVPNERLTFIQSFSDKDGNNTRHPMSPTWPLEMLATTTFEDIDNKTKSQLLGNRGTLTILVTQLLILHAME